MEQSKLNKSFEVASISRADLENFFSPEQIESLTTGDMKEIARKMGDLYCDLHYWEDLESVAETVFQTKKQQEEKQ